jgi:hypothetical protein
LWHRTEIAGPISVARVLARETHGTEIAEPISVARGVARSFADFARVENGRDERPTLADVYERENLRGAARFEREERGEATRVGREEREDGARGSGAGEAGRCDRMYGAPRVGDVPNARSMVSEVAGVGRVVSISGATAGRLVDLVG